MERLQRSLKKENGMLVEAGVAPKPVGGDSSPKLSRATITAIDEVGARTWNMELERPLRLLRKYATCTMPMFAASG